MSASAAVRLRRILAVVPYLLANPGTSVQDLCERFDVSDSDLVADLELLWFCGLPPYGPGDLFDVVIEGDRIWLSGAESLARPFGLDRATAARMLLGAKLLAGTSASGVPGDLESGAVKLAAALGEHPVDVAASGSEREAAFVEELRKAGGEHRVVRLTYWSFARESEDVRDVEPLRLVLRRGHWYLSAWCRSAEGLRSFRLDRVRGVEVLDERFERDVEPGEFGYRPAPDDVHVTLELDPDAAWVVERYPSETCETLDDGTIRVTMAAPSGAFFERLLVRLGRQARVIDPRWLDDARRERARKVRSLYTD